MGILGGVFDVVKSAGSFASAPLVGAAKIVGTQIETGLKVTGSLLTLQPGKALDELKTGLHQQVDNVIGIPRQEWSAVKGAASGLGETLASGARFVGEPIRGAARIAANNLTTAGGSASQALQGNIGGAVGEMTDGVSRNGSILVDTARNQFDNLF